MKKQILMIGFSDARGREQRRKLKKELADRQIRIAVKPVPEADFGRTLGDLAGLKADSAGRPLLSGGLPSLPAPSAAPAGQSPAEGSAAVSVRLLVMCGLDGTEQDLMLSLFSDTGITRDDLKAVLTPANSQWTVRELADALQKEHIQLHKG